ncbi:RNA polymerase II elongation factor Ell isoform X2 [Chelonus insularis]|nr:RNA polymerase II elongation factor Ell-like isoform X2 [Chelonus insularis]XP_034952782.1 RNA polymerase II elongation factor Ell-like isoform X2 [Chelonus insularis]XP_034952783.1 RNA polymerase II elongation factor Ell-like isoform X2 [Chelonus insularis]
MRIQANDDVYETTRHRMAVAEENNKNKCTRVIKPNGPDIGRKVKVKTTTKSLPPPANIRHRESIIPNSTNKSMRVNSSLPSLSTSSSNQVPIPTPPTSVVSSIKSHKPVTTNNNPPARQQSDKKMSELMRRPLKERLIHVLALRPYKKPELYDRIVKEGIKERERSTLTSVIRQVAYMRDNTYHLHRHVWNDVHEDWPFYTEQDKAMLKRRKPQNLTPPGSSDGSSGSGQSPNSNHPGSPTAITAPPPNLNYKRPGYYEGSDGFQTKRPRISHYRKPEANSRTEGNNNPSSVISGNEANNWVDQRQNCDRVDYGLAERTTNSEVIRGNVKPCLTPTSDCEEVTSNRYAVNWPSNQQISNNNNHNSSVSNNNNNTNGNDKVSGRSESANLDYINRGVNNENGRRNREERRDRERDREQNNVNNNVNECDFPNLGASNYPGNHGHGNGSLSLPEASPAVPSDSKPPEYPDYLTQYTTISSIEQRKRYKQDFYNDYEEYRRLYEEVNKVSKRFAQLQEQRERALELRNYENTEALEKQILAEYIATKSDPVKMEAKRRYQYLHEKLGYIKRLVFEYDNQYFADGDTNIKNNNGKSVNEGDLRY